MLNAVTNATDVLIPDVVLPLPSLMFILRRMQATIQHNIVNVFKKYDNPVNSYTVETAFNDHR